MTKITVDKDLIEQALDALQNHQGNYKLSKAECKKQEAVEDALRAALAKQAVEPVAWLHEWADGEKVPMLHGRDNRSHDQPISVIPLYASPPPAEVPLLTYDEMVEAHPVLYGLPADDIEFARGIEQAVRQKAGLK